jgi:hypothetical protein
MRGKIEFFFVLTLAGVERLPSQCDAGAARAFQRSALRKRPEHRRSLSCGGAGAP